MYLKCQFIVCNQFLAHVPIPIYLGLSSAQKTEISFGDSGVKGLYILPQQIHPGWWPLDHCCFIIDMSLGIQRATRESAHVVILWLLDAHANMKDSRLWGEKVFCILVDTNVRIYILRTVSWNQVVFI